MSNSSIEEEIRTTGRLVYTNRGRSMLPLIREGRDVVVLERPAGRLKKYDVPLYKPTPFTGAYVLHRIIKVRENDYVIRGDNCIRKEVGIRDEDIVGVLVSVLRAKGAPGGEKGKNSRGGAAGEKAGKANRRSGSATAAGGNAGVKEIKVTSFGYKFYSRLWVLLFPFRYMWAGMKSVVRRIVR